MRSASLAKVHLLGARGGDDFGARAFDDYFAIVQQRDALREGERRVHVVLDHHDGDVTRHPRQHLAHLAAFLLAQSRERLAPRTQQRLLHPPPRPLQAPSPPRASSRTRPLGFCATSTPLAGRRRSPYEVSATVRSALLPKPASASAS